MSPRYKAVTLHVFQPFKWLCVTLRNNLLQKKGGQLVSIFLNAGFLGLPCSVHKTLVLRHSAGPLSRPWLPSTSRLPHGRCPCAAVDWTVRTKRALLSQTKQCWALLAPLALLSMGAELRWSPHMYVAYTYIHRHPGAKDLVLSIFLFSWITNYHLSCCVH